MEILQPNTVTCLPRSSLSPPLSLSPSLSPPLSLSLSLYSVIMLANCRHTALKLLQSERKAKSRYKRPCFLSLAAGEQWGSGCSCIVWTRNNGVFSTSTPTWSAMSEAVITAEGRLRSQVKVLWDSKWTN
jgi:hypothetical protein